MPQSRRVFAVLAIAVVIALAVGATTLLAVHGRPNSTNSGPQLIFAEFSSIADHVYLAPADDPARRTLVTAVDHVDGWGLNPAVAPTGSRVAYTVLAPGAMPQADAPAELWLLDVRSHVKTRLASDADLRVPAIFDSGGKYLVYRSSAPGGQQSLVRVEVATGARRPLYQAATAFGIFPVGFGHDGSLVYAGLSAQGTDFYRITEGQQPVPLLHASDQLARDWRMSPDGSAIAFLAPQLLAERVVYRLQVVYIDGNASPVPVPTTDGPTAEQYAPVWTPDGRAVTVGREAAPEKNAAASTLAITGGTPVALVPPVRGFDTPLAWSANGNALAVRTFDGTSAASPGNESTTVLADGQRHTVTGSGDIIVFGWLNGG